MAQGVARALLVDDRERPRALAAAELRRALPEVKLEVAGSREETVRLLDKFATESSSPEDPFLFAVLRDGMAWGEGMDLPHAIRDRLPHVPLILTCDPNADEAPEAACDPARAGQVTRREGLEEAIPIAGDNVAAIAAAAEACLKLDRVTSERDRLIAERNQLAEERRAVEQKVDSLLQASAKTAEAEAGDRRRLALVLHEDMLQLLVAARMFLACAQNPVSGDEPDPDAGPLTEIDSLLIRSVQLCKDLTGLWSPLVLYEAGLVAALRWLGETTRIGATDSPENDASENTGDSAFSQAGPLPGTLVAEVDCDDDAEPDTQDSRTLLYQAAVELLSNVARHAGVDHARLTLRRMRTDADSPDLLSLTVSDKGCGFDPSAPRASSADDEGTAAADGTSATVDEAPSPAAPAKNLVDTGDPISNRFGLFSLSERLRLAGGRMEIESVAGRGTIVRLLCPINAGRFTQRPLFADSEAALSEHASSAADSSATPPIKEGSRGSAPPPHSHGGTPRATAPPDTSTPEPAADASAAPPIRVLLADDHRIIRLSLSGLLGRAPGITVVGQAVDGEDVLEKTAELRPDVVLMDVNMPKLDGVEATRRLKARWPETRVIALSMHESDDREFDMFEAGAECYVVKDGPPEQLIRAVLGDSSK
ncbi:Chemotaxis response regulator protein-glutamate methylesterase [Planctomycetes bacterium LzC2]|uniref:Chemotaxis response regulator protein-glutamate methylesterase n=1 Tax=Alienimonas chondri TaxID=2681879 RepID=A0ABX1VFG9_9PLAN|nr:Chemotaxis response regulator protein-glutamate methylesterase [Alienimonas chondri]